MRKRPMTSLHKKSSSLKKDKFNIKLTKFHQRKQSLFGYNWPLKNSGSNYMESNKEIDRYDVNISVQIQNKSLSKMDYSKSPDVYDSENKGIKPTQTSRITKEITKLNMKFIKSGTSNKKLKNKSLTKRKRSMESAEDKQIIEENEPSLNELSSENQKSKKNKIDLPKQLNKVRVSTTFGKRKRFSQIVDLQSESMFDYKSSERFIKVTQSKNRFKKKLPTISHFDKEDPSILENQLNNYQSNSEISVSQNERSERSSKYKRLKGGFYSGNLHNRSKNLNFKNDLYPNSYKESEERFVKFGMILEK
mmetsp:Transcript_10481/g.9257  ORF Transcript_10481/g.9257 Transcript_10481/m.9257 type:complete len:306 (-) Transcript_10481:549-1466(-)